MKGRFSILSGFFTLIAISTGVVVLFYFFFPTPENLVIRSVLLQWAVTLAAVALLIGMGNLLGIHYRKLNEEGGNWFYSLILIIALIATFFLVLIMGPTHAWSSMVFNTIQVPVEASLMAILAVSLAYASARLLRRRMSLLSIVFLGTVLIVLAGTSPFVTENAGALGGALRSLRAWIAQVPAAAGARGILLGVALGTIATGLRILFGADRPYGG
jgi:uncharacterized membrane protein YhaH (DUF805 family)